MEKVIRAIHDHWHADCIQMGPCEHERSGPCAATGRSQASRAPLAAVTVRGAGAVLALVLDS